mmetsp:Transcript_6429/g.12845  ORF Transcript_6429/g.12845 Transcript_6429/m.12845 type:complete len:87 (+) Transcript_6429:1348-1608(+)
MMPTIFAPQLYDGWFHATLDLEKGLCESVYRVMGARIDRIEAYFPPVPNLDEVAFGTAINQRFAIEISERMGISQKGKYAIVRRYH